MVAMFFYWMYKFNHAFSIQLKIKRCFFCSGITGYILCVSIIYMAVKMALLEERIEFAKNPEQRCPVVLLLDNSYSMNGEPINELNESIQLFKQEVQKDQVAALRVEVAVVTFGDRPRLVQDFSNISDFNPPKLQAKGNTPMGAAIELALDKLEERKSIYKRNGVPYYRPWVLLISDGAPTDDYSKAALRIRSAFANRKLSFFCIAVRNADISVLRTIAPESTPPLPLEGLEFKPLFKWLSASVTAVAHIETGEQVDIPDFSGWKRTTA